VIIRNDKIDHLIVPSERVYNPWQHLNDAAGGSQQYGELHTHRRLMELGIDCLSDDVVHSEQKRTIYANRIRPERIFDGPYSLVKLLLYEVICIVHTR
jgi:hypothetical protein